MPSKVLIIEDEIALRQAYAMVLKIRGYDVAVAENGLVGLQRLKAHPPDLIILDMLMPRMDGLAFMKAANLAEAYPLTKVILLSNFSRSDQIDEIIGLGVAANALKADITPDQLISLIETTLHPEVLMSS